LRVGQIEITIKHKNSIGKYDFLGNSPLILFEFMIIVTLFIGNMICPLSRFSLGKPQDIWIPLTGSEKSKITGELNVIVCITNSGRN
jgi:hypothetical protein